jgi:hypothetical protein
MHKMNLSNLKEQIGDKNSKKNAKMTDTEYALNQDILARIKNQ